MVSRFSDAQVELDSGTAEDVLRRTFEVYGEKSAVASSFGAEDVVLIDMAVRINPRVRIFTLDTGRLPQETYVLMDEIIKKYGITIEVCFPNRQRVQELADGHGFNSFYRGIEERKLCCNVRKVEPLREKLKELDAWICGLRKEQSPTRTDIRKVEIDISNKNIVKINPLADWKETDVWAYIKKYDIPYNRLHDEGYPSIGCEPCTRAVRIIEDVRAGRWWWETKDQKECGLHANSRN